jgi:arylsulfatase A-like enzyme
MEGDSILRLIDGDRDASDWRDGVFVQQMSNEGIGRTIRTDRWKYAVTAPHGDTDQNPQPDRYVERFLYDLWSDPDERRNLIGNTDHAERAATLRDRLLTRIEDVEGKRPVIERADYRP